jgi:gliding motility-associated-like protein
LFWNNITGSAKIYGNAFSPNSQNLGGTIEIGGDAEIGGTCSAGKYLQSPGIMFSPTSTPRSACDGLVNHELNNDINKPVTLYTAAEMTFSKFLMCGAEVGNLPERTLSFPEVAAKRYGEAAFSLGVTSSSNESITYTSSNTNVAEVDPNGTVTVKGVGTVKITAVTPINSNYRNRALAERILTINKGVQSISAVDPGILKLQDGSATLTASSTVGLPLSFEITNGWIGWLDGSNLTFKQPGTTDIIIRQAGNNLYDAAPPVKLTVTIEDNANGPVLVNKAISPNNDGINDYFNIRGIELYGDNAVSILSSNGVEVYKAKGYDNARVLFDGRTNEGARLPAGTYFYVIKIRDKDQAWKVMKGYFALGYN